MAPDSGQRSLPSTLRSVLSPAFRWSFSFGTNWARFSVFAGGVIGQTLAMEGVFAFFLESSFLGLFLFGEKKLGPRLHFFAAVMAFIGSWLSGYLIVATNAWMQHPIAYVVGANGNLSLSSFWGLLFNPWIGWQDTHNMIGAVVTSSFVLAAVGAFYLLAHTHEEYGKAFLRIGVLAGVVASILVAFPTGDGQGRNVAFHSRLRLLQWKGCSNPKKARRLSL